MKVDSGKKTVCYIAGSQNTGQNACPIQFQTCFYTCDKNNPILADKTLIDNPLNISYFSCSLSNY